MDFSPVKHVYTYLRLIDHEEVIAYNVYTLIVIDSFIIIGSHR